MPNSQEKKLQGLQIKKENRPIREVQSKTSETVTLRKYRSRSSLTKNFKTPSERYSAPNVSFIYVFYDFNIFISS